MSHLSVRVSKLKSAFHNRFNSTPEIIVRSPGRVNLIGEHTDYNFGYVLPAAINKCFLMAFAPNDENRINICALDLGESISFSLEEDLLKEDGWSVYLKGILSELRKRGRKYTGFNLAFTSDIPIGAGLSSSTALDCGFLKGIDALHNFKLENWEIVDISNQSNNLFIGVQGGILDQFAIVFGKKDSCMMLDCRNREWSYSDIHLDHYEWLLFDTKVRHDHTISDYNNRSEECRQLVQIIKKKDRTIRSLRDVTLALLEEHVNLIPEAIYRRGKFIINENERVLQFAEALKNRDVSLLGKLLYESHEGLKKEYEVSCDELDFLVELAKDSEGVAGARMVGGGFGGCTINLIHHSQKNIFIKEVEKLYSKIFNRSPGIITFAISDGLSLVDQA